MKTITTIPVNTLKAALLFAPKDDVRYYLNGVYIDPTRRLCVATDGATMLVARIEAPESHTNGDTPGAPYIVPRETLEAGLKAWGKATPDIVLTHDSETRKLRVGNLSGEAVNGKFPEFERVIPRTLIERGTVGSFNPEYIARANKGLCMIIGANPGRTFADLHHNGPNMAGLLTLSGSNALAIVMPMRAEPDKVNVSEYVDSVIGDTTKQGATAA